MMAKLKYLIFIEKKKGIKDEIITTRCLEYDASVKRCFRFVTVVF